MVNINASSIPPSFIRRWFLPSVLCVIGVLFNFAGAQICAFYGLPLFLDSVGTIFTAVVGGYIPGVLVGFVTNLLSGWKSVNVYYGMLNIVIGLLAACFGSKNFFQKVSGCILSILSFSIVGGGAGSVITWLLYEGNIGEGISSTYALGIRNAFHLSPFLSQLIADMAIDVADKTVVVLLVVLLLHVIPNPVQRRFRLQGWRQAPLEKVQLKEIHGETVRRVPLRAKIIFLLAGAITLVGVVVTLISFQLFHAAVIEEQGKLALGVCHVVQGLVDGNRIEEYLIRGEDAPGYLEVKAKLKDLMESSSDISFVYVYKIMEDGCHVVFDPDTEEVPGAPAGSIVPFDESFGEYIPALLRGEEIPLLITNDTFGWLMTAYLPIKDDAGVTQCYACVDISMEMLADFEHGFLTKVISLCISFFILIVSIGVWTAEYHVILPINSMAMAANAFAYDNDGALEENTKRLEALEIQTGDEIEKLYHSLTKTTKDSVKYIQESEEKNQQISRFQNGLINVLADLVESRDACTGNHVKNTATYVRITAEQMRGEGIYEDLLTDDYISDITNAAPLHDVGKITVPDALLNKPGKLTPEEFELMKGHAAAGGEIIERAIDAVIGEAGTDTSYLKEAKNLATYHHEKWNGQGYPKGLSGEDIPLSARIMAVADVFDALVSKRSYKDGFPFEKAMSIIEEGIGTHFDPQVATAFIHAKDQVKAVLDAERMEQVGQTV